ncbi:MAG TPA: NAD-dependent epimerase/dehydratase family protein [Bdellovibrionota bacterium]|jgi:nucleoside-diphosphate-sugar epimerase
MKKKILLTGGAGFIGFHLGRFLADKGHEVHLLDSFYRGVRDPDLAELVKQPNVKLIEADLETQQFVNQCANDYDFIYHLAAVIGVSKVLSEPFNVLSKNFVLLMNALELAKRQKNLQRFVFFSTSEVYAGTLAYFGIELPTPESTPLTSMDVTSARSSYMLSKIYGEGMCAHSGVPHTIIRPHNIYGPRMGLSHVIPELLQKGYNAPTGAAIDVFSVSHSRTFCYISDAVEMITRLAESPAGLNGTFNVGNETPEVKIGQLAETVFAVVEKQQKVNAQADTPGSPARRCPSMSKTKSATQYEGKVGLREGILHTYDWYRKNVFTGQGVSAK